MAVKKLHHRLQARHKRCGDRHQNSQGDNRLIGYKRAFAPGLPLYGGQTREILHRYGCENQSGVAVDQGETCIVDTNRIEIGCMGQIGEKNIVYGVYSKL